MENAYLEKLVDRAQKMALRNIWGENSYKINMAILKRDPYNCAAYTRLAKYYKLEGNIDEAKNMYLKVMEIDPNNRGAMNNLIEIEREEKEDNAVDQIKAIGDLSKEGQKSMVKGRYKLAAKLFAKAFGLKPSLVHAVSLAGAYKKVGRYDLIEKIYDQLIDENSKPNDIEEIKSEFKLLRSNAYISSEKENGSKAEENKNE